MTELQPSPAGYRGQDDLVTPAKIITGPPGCKFTQLNHHPVQQPVVVPTANRTKVTQQQQQGSPVKDPLHQIGNYNCNGTDNGFVGTPVGKVGLLGNSDGQQQEVDNGFRDNYFKKNAPGYKNDSGYSESLGFDSFSLPLSERDASSPPPTPPVRDASSLKSLCYGPGHEKYPSWPTAGATSDENQLQVGSHRSKSWTEQTSYPKEKPSQYTRPVSGSTGKRPSSTTFTQQLKTVMERCEKIPPEAFESKGVRKLGTTGPETEKQQLQQQQSPRMWPSVDREGNPLGDAEYHVPSPPERESLTGQTLSPADLEAYVRSYQDPEITSQMELYGDGSLTQVGLEEYTRVQHSQQASYAQSEGYHSYVSSVDSTTTTPFLDRLRRDSEAVSQRSISVWEDALSREGRDSVVTTSSGSASSSETLKWHGSMSDVSVSSGLPPASHRSVGSSSDRWHHGSMSDVSSLSSGLPLSMAPSSSSSVKQLDEFGGSNHNSNSRVHQQHHRAHDWENSVHGSMSDVSSQVNGAQPPSKQLIAHSARVQTPQRHHSESVLYMDRERSQRKLYPISTSKPDEDQLINRLPPTSPKQSTTSVAERISELEKQHHQQQQQQLKYTYLDPEKRHKVPDPTLKVIQKKALLSFYERHQQQTSWKSEPQLAQSTALATAMRHSPPPQPPPRPRPSAQASRRASSASDYSSVAGGWKNGKANSNSNSQETNQQSASNSPDSSDKTTNIANNNAMPAPRHQHSNSCGSLTNEQLLGPVIVGSPISIDDWVPERPPKKPHLRVVFGDRRLPSPDLPPPSPPTITDEEVLNCDEPLPPPPADLDVQDDQHKPKQYPSRSAAARRSSRRRRALAISDNAMNGKSLSPQGSSSSASSPTSPKSPPPPSSSLLENGFDIPIANGFVRSSVRYSMSQKSPQQGSKDSAEQQRFGDSGNQKAAPQVPVLSATSREVEPRIKRQESLKIEDTKQWLESSRQQQQQPEQERPRAQVPVVAPTTAPTPTVQHPQQQSQYQRSNGQQQETPKSRVNRSSQLKYNSDRSRYGPPSQKYPEDGNPESTAPGVVLQVAKSQSSPPPPPLAPRKSMPPPPRPAPPTGNAVQVQQQPQQGSQSKASYLTYRRERSGGATDSCGGSYKRTMSPSGPEPVLLRVAPHSPPLVINGHHRPYNNNNNNNNLINNNNHHSPSNGQQPKKDGSPRSQSPESPRIIANNNNNKEPRLSPQSVEVLNDRNRQLERERQKLVEDLAIGPRSSVNGTVTTIEMTSRNVELLNRRNAELRNNVLGLVSSPTQTDHLVLPSLLSNNHNSSSSCSNSSQSLCSSLSPASSLASSTSSPRVSPKSGIEGLALMQRTEVVLRVNAATSDASSQTEMMPMMELQQQQQIHRHQQREQCQRHSQSSEDERRLSPRQLCQGLVALEALEGLAHQPRKKSQEEIDCEELSRDLVNQLGPDDKLLTILVPLAEHKKSTDYVGDLFRIHEPGPKSPNSPASRSPSSTSASSSSSGSSGSSDRNGHQQQQQLSIESASPQLDHNSCDDTKKIDSIPPASPTSSTGSEPHHQHQQPLSPLSPTSAYFTTSEARARFLARYHSSAEESDRHQPRDEPQTQPKENGDRRTSPAFDTLDLRQKKEELVIRLDKKLAVLRSEQEAVREEGELNEALGARVASRLASCGARPTEASKFRLHVEEVGKITSLLLSLSGRLARAENALYGMPADHPDRKILEGKRDKLLEQLEEAKVLKGNIDRRSLSVSATLAKYLGDEEFADYQHFVSMKAKLIVDTREIQDKIKLGEEQLAALKEAIG